MGQADRRGGLVVLAQGRFSGRVRRQASRRAVASTLSYIAALSGDQAGVGRWSAVTLLQPRNLVPRPSDDVLVDSVVDLRGGRAKAVLARLEASWAELESSLTGEVLRPIRLYRAFATAQTLDERSSPMVEPLLAALRPARVGELDHLAVAWPELGAFLHQHGFARTAAKSAA